MNEEFEQVYLGDGAYAKQIGSDVKLWTTTGEDETNVIWVTTEMIDFLSRWIR